MNLLVSNLKKPQTCCDWMPLIAQTLGSNIAIYAVHDLLVFQLVRLAHSSGRRCTHGTTYVSSAFFFTIQLSCRSHQTGQYIRVRPHISLKERKNGIRKKSWKGHDNKIKSRSNQHQQGNTQTGLTWVPAAPRQLLHSCNGRHSWQLAQRQMGRSVRVEQLQHLIYRVFHVRREARNKSVHYRKPMSTKKGSNLV